MITEADTDFRVVPIHFRPMSSCEILGNQCLRLARFLAEFGHQQKNSGQTFLTGIEKLINKIGLDPHTAVPIGTSSNRSEQYMLSMPSPGSSLFPELS